MLAEDGILESLLGAEEIATVSNRRLEEVLVSNVDQEYYCQDQVKLFVYFSVFCHCDQMRALINYVLHKKEVF